MHPAMNAVIVGMLALLVCLGADAMLGGVSPLSYAAQAVGVATAALLGYASAKPKGPGHG